MRALVLKTNAIVDIVRKDGNHYIDSNFNPYTKEELEFFIKQNKKVSNDEDDDEREEISGFEFNGQFISFEEFAKMQSITTALDKLLWLSASVIEQHPDYSSNQVASYCFSIYRILKEGLRRQN